MNTMKKTVIPKKVIKSTDHQTPKKVIKSTDLCISDSDSIKSDSEISIDSNNQIDLSYDHIDRKTIEMIAGFSIGSDITLYQRAFVHKSIEKLAQKDPNAKEYMKQSNETLEFVGDSMLGAVVADYLFTKYPDKDEGFLTTTRTKIVKSQTLSYFAECVGMGDKILMANQAIRTGGKKNKRFLEDAFESFLGALYYDKGFYGVQQFLIMVITKHFDENLITKNDNYKDILLRYSQYIKTDMPEYNVINEDGPPHRKEFTVEVKLFGKRQGKAKGSTIKKAEQLAASSAIKRLEIDPKF